MILGIMLVMVAAAGLARLLRSTNLPGHAVVAGLVVGIVLGPSVLGRIAPEYFTVLFDGGRGQAAEQYNALLALRDHAAVNPGVTPPSPDALAAARDAWDAQRYRDQQPARIAITLLAALLLLSGAPQRRPPGASPASSAIADVGWLAPVSIGLWAALLPGGVAYLLLHFVLDFEQPAALAAAAGVAIGSWSLSRIDHAAADNAEIGGHVLMQRAALVASLVAISALLCSAWLGDTWLRLPWCAPLLLVIVLARGLAQPSRSMILTAQPLMIAALTALAMLRVDLLEAFSFWATLLIVLLSGDGRWTGAFLGAMLPGGRRSLRTMRLVMPAMAAVPTQLALASVGASAWLFPQELTLALLLGVAALDAAAPVRAATVDRLLEVEHELDQSE